MAGFKTLDELMAESIQAALRSEDLVDRVKKAADQAVSEAIASAFSYSSPFRKMVQHAVQEALPVVGADDLNVFAVCVREVVQRRLVNLADQEAQRQMNQVLQSILPDSTVITMRELRDRYIEMLRGDHSLSDCDCGDDTDEPEFTWKTESSSVTDGWFDLIVSPNDGAGRFDKETIALRFKPVRDGLVTNLFECWHARMGSAGEMIGSVFAGRLFGFDAMVFRLYTGGSRLLVE